MHHTETNYHKPNIFFNIQEEHLKIEIETERLFIRSYEIDDFENCVQLYGDKTLTKYFDHGRPKSKLEVENLIKDKTIYFSKLEPFGVFSIFQKKDMAFIGQVDLIPFDQPGVLEIGCIFDKRYHNQGLCPETVRAVIFDYVKKLNENGFKCNGSPIHKIIATVHPENSASKRIIQNIGMIFDKSEERFGQLRLWFSINHELSLQSHTWTPQEYSLHSSIQKNAAYSLLKYICLRGDERVLDVGCGDGKIAANIANLVPTGYVKGIDISEEMIYFAKTQFSNINLDFSIQDAQELKYNAEYDIVFSSFALQWLKNKNSFFKEAYNSLKNHGSLLITVPLGISDALEQSINSLIISKEWSSYFSKPFFNKLANENDYKKIIEKNCFLINRFEILPQENLFSSRQDFEKYVYQWFVYLHMLPEHLKEVFFQKVIDNYLKIEPLLSDGSVIFKFSILNIIASKKIC